MAWTYILKCSDDSYYVGSCRNLEHRVWQHSTGLGSKYTSKRIPVVLVFAHEFDNVGEAYAFEKQIQGWSRAKREALMAQDFNEIRRLSKKKFTQVPGRRE
ncbi:MAG TPA: GIY-YIG nuclease family protein [Galbitalea sp.]|jgi:putative endonuclease